MLTSRKEQILCDTIHNVCKNCNLNFLTYDELRRHLATSRRHHYCEECDDDFVNAEVLRSHYQALHYYCAQCGVVRILFPFILWLTMIPCSGSFPPAS